MRSSPLFGCSISVYWLQLHRVESNWIELNYPQLVWLQFGQFEAVVCVSLQCSHLSGSIEPIQLDSHGWFVSFQRYFIELKLTDWLDWMDVYRAIVVLRHQLIGSLSTDSFCHFSFCMLRASLSLFENRVLNYVLFYLNLFFFFCFVFFTNVNAGFEERELAWF